jgi:hypothetical protein
LTVAARVAVVMPACDEEAAIGPVLAEIAAVVGWPVAVGVNGSRDRTAAVARACGACVGETAERGYGHGCLAAVGALRAEGIEVDGYLFAAADGASDPRDWGRLVAAMEAGNDLVIGTRLRGERAAENAAVMGPVQAWGNRVLAVWASWLSGRRVSDLGPTRIIARDWLERIAFRELTFGWTIEAQVVAASEGARIVEVPVAERPRIAGEQKISKAGWGRAARVAASIGAAGWRARRRATGRAAKI